MSIIIGIIQSIVCLVIGFVIGAIAILCALTNSTKKAKIDWRFGNADKDEPLFVFKNPKPDKEEQTEEIEDKCVIGFRY